MNQLIGEPNTSLALAEALDRVQQLESLLATREAQLVEKDGQLAVARDALSHIGRTKKTMLQMLQGAQQNVASMTAAGLAGAVRIANQALAAIPAQR